MHAYMQTYMHACIYTYIHTYMYREHEREETKKIDRWIIDTERERDLRTTAGDPQQMGPSCQLSASNRSQHLVIL